MNLQNKKRLTDLENELTVAGGRDGEAIVRELRMDVYTRWVYIFKMDNEQGPTI